jgi:hypothetical protein
VFEDGGNLIHDSTLRGTKVFSLFFLFPPQKQKNRKRRTETEGKKEKNRKDRGNRKKRGDKKHGKGKER